MSFIAFIQLHTMQFITLHMLCWTRSLKEIRYKGTDERSKQKGAY